MSVPSRYDYIYAGINNDQPQITWPPFCNLNLPISIWDDHPYDDWKLGQKKWRYGKRNSESICKDRSRLSFNYFLDTGSHFSPEEIGSFYAKFYPATLDFFSTFKPLRQKRKHLRLFKFGHVADGKQDGKSFKTMRFDQKSTEYCNFAEESNESVRRPDEIR